MICPCCYSVLKEIKTKIKSVETELVSYQCLECKYFDLDEKSAEKIIEELT